MKIGFNEATAMKKSDLKTDLQMTEKYGYDYIEIRLDMLQDYLENNSMNDLKKFFSDSHLQPYAFNSIEDINFCYGENREKLKKEVEWACQLAKEINNPYLVVVPTVDDLVLKHNKKEIEEDSIKILNVLADISEKYNVKLAFEPIGFENCAVNNMKQCWEIVQKINRDSIGMVIDTFNIFLYNSLDDIHDLEEIDLEKIFVFHINDSEDLPLEKLDHCHRLWPGDGIIPLNDILKILNSKGFDKIASVELFRPEYWELSPEENIKTGKMKVEKVFEEYLD